MTIKCLHCGERFIVSACREHLQHCSRECYLASLRLDEGRVKKLAERFSGNRRAVADYLDIPYPTFYRKLKAQGINNVFRGAGKWERD